MSSYDFDLFIIGAGSGGVRAARFAAQRGARVAVAEHGPLGGTCVNVGCIPKKLFSYAAHMRDDLAGARGFGWSGDPLTFDWTTLLANKDAEISRLNGVYERLLQGVGVALLRGHAVVRGANEVAVDDRLISAAHILVATGGRAVVPNVPGADLAMTSDQAFHLAQLPSSVAVVGGGYIALEFASIFNGLGVATTLVHRREQVLREFDADLGAFLLKQMGHHGVQLQLGRQIESIRLESGATVAGGTGSQLWCSLKGVASDDAPSRRSTPDGAASSGGVSPAANSHDASLLAVDAVMYATGRVPNTAGLGLAEAGVRLSASGAVEVDEAFQTAVPSIHAIGDCIERVQLTPVALSEGMFVADRLFGSRSRTVSYEDIPTAVFSHPNVATVGLSEAAARQRYRDVSIFRSEFAPLKEQLARTGTRALVKLVVDAASDRVLGVHMVGPEAGEIIQGFAVALKCGATKAQFDATLGVHPTLAEEFVTMREPVRIAS